MDTDIVLPDSNSIYCILNLFKSYFIKLITIKFWYFTVYSGFTSHGYKDFLFSKLIV